MVQIGITERGNAAINTDWKTWVYSYNKPAILITKNPIKLIEEELVEIEDDDGIVKIVPVSYIC